MNSWPVPSAFLPTLPSVPARSSSRPHLFGRARATSPEPVRETRERLDRFSHALLHLYAPCPPRDFPRRVLEVVDRVLPGTLPCFLQLDLNSGDSTCQLPDATGLDTATQAQHWRRCAREHPIVRAHQRQGGEEVATYLLDEVLPPSARKGSPLELELLQPLGVTQQLAILLPLTDLATGLFLSRAGAFSEVERHLVSLLAPHLAQAHHNHLLLTPPQERPTAYRNLAWQRLRSAGFSRRECEVLQWLAEGKGDDEIALILSLSRKTVSNQVLALMHRLQARNRIGVVTAALQIMEMPHPVALEAAAGDREEQFQAHLLRLAGAATPADLLQHLRRALAEMWPGMEAEAWLIRIDDPANRFAALNPARVEAYGHRLALHSATAPQGSHGAAPVLGAPQGTMGAIRYLPLPPDAYVWENRAAPAGELLTALVLPPERLAIAVVVRTDARGFGTARLEEWHRLVPHLLVATRHTHRVAQESDVLAMPAPPPDSPLWVMMESLQLTERQIETLAWVAAGSSDQEIAQQLSVSVRTVHSHLRAIFEILGVENRLSAVVAACRYLSRQLAYQPD